jgi:hypothetical protein
LSESVDGQWNLKGGGKFPLNISRGMTKSRAFST